MQTEIIDGKRRVDVSRVSRAGEHCPQATAFGGTHGAMAQDDAGNMYVSTQSETGVLVYSPEGAFLKTIATTIPKFTPWCTPTKSGVGILLLHGAKRNTAGELALHQDEDRRHGGAEDHGAAGGGFQSSQRVAPHRRGARARTDRSLLPTAMATRGSSASTGRANTKPVTAAKGATDGLDCSHGLAVDTRYDQPLLLVCDRENRRLCHFDFDGKYVGTVTRHLRRPCQVSFHGDHAVVSELEGRTTILDRDNVPVAFLGDNPRKTNGRTTMWTLADHGRFVQRRARMFRR